MRKRKRGEPAHDNEERWLLTYADLITLLLGLFVILYAMSKIDAGKYAEVVTAMEGVFGSPRGIMTGGSSGMMQMPVPSLRNEQQHIVDELRSALHLDDKKLPISISYNERGITVHIMEELLFASGAADVKATSLAALDSLAMVLRTITNDIRVEGHTDNIPIKTQFFPSNWHLSVARAVNVGYYLIEHHGLNAEQVSVVGYSEYHPLVPNDTPENRAKNRRVDIVIMTPSQSGRDITPPAGASASKESPQ
jgi:chemotaxis protein MotB